MSLKFTNFISVLKQNTGGITLTTTNVLNEFSYVVNM